jgi:hypothetical protein
LHACFTFLLDACLRAIELAYSFSKHFFIC